MSDAALGLSMLGLIVVVIMLGFPTAFTLMGLGMFFGFIAFYDPSQHWLSNRIFDLMVQRAAFHHVAHQHEQRYRQQRVVVHRTVGALHHEREDLVSSHGTAGS